LEDFLQHAPGVPMDAGRRESLAALTMALAGRSRRRRWWPIAAAVAAAVALALASGYLGYRTGRAEAAARPVIVEQKRPTPDEQMPLPAPETPREDVKPVPSARELEWTAFDADSDRARVKLYFQAGDLYLAGNNDIESALRCYTQALYYGDAQDVEIAPSDNWLVTAVKRDHKER
jgi:hypothetical protein